MKTGRDTMKILIALDAGPQSAEIVREVASRAWPAKSRFLLLNVLDPYPYTKMPMSLASAKAGISAKLSANAERLIKSGWKAETAVVVGRARQDISKMASSWKADLVLVGSSEEGPLMRALLGSTARSVLRHAPCSVGIVRPVGREKKGKHQGVIVWVANHGADCSLAALRAGAKSHCPIATP